ncbi:MAG: hypothetical protein ACOX8U_07695 [Bradymonadia bacterium]
MIHRQKINSCISKDTDIPNYFFSSPASYKLPTDKTLRLSLDKITVLRSYATLLALGTGELALFVEVTTLTFAAGGNTVCTCKITIAFVVAILRDGAACFAPRAGKIAFIVQVT